VDEAVEEKEEVGVKEGRLGGESCWRRFRRRRLWIDVRSLEETKAA